MPLSPSPSILTDTPSHAGADSGNGGGDNGDSNSGGDRSMLVVLCSQRDRFRKRAQELEEGIAQISTDLARVRKTLEASRADNLALVERLKFVQGYQDTGKSRKGVSHPSIFPPPSTSAPSPPSAFPPL